MFVRIRVNFGNSEPNLITALSLKKSKNPILPVPISVVRCKS